MVPIYICDDEMAVLEKITAIVENQLLIGAFDMGPVFSTSSQNILLNECEKKNISSVYFLDVDFSSGQDGFQLASQIREIDPHGYIIFITGHP